MDIVLIRHGETEANRDGIFGTPQTRLTQKGLDQARLSARAAQDLGIDKVLVSPYKRALDTMACLGLEGEIEEDIREISLGIIEGYSYEDFYEEYKEEADSWTQDFINYRLDQGESVVDAYARVEKVLDRLIEEDQDTILVCHEGVIRLALSTIFEDPNLFFRFKSDNLGFTRIRVEAGYKYIDFLNRIYY